MIKMPGDCVTLAEWDEMKFGTSGFCFMELAIV